MDETAVEVVAVREVGPDTVAVDLRPPSGFDARPGQFVQVRATVDGERVTRHYSVSSPAVDGTVEITVGVDPDGTLSPRLASAEPGDEVAIDGPFGRVYYEDEPRVAVLCAGPGIGPAVGVAERALRDGGEVAVVYRADAPVHEERLAALARGGARIFLASDDGTFSRAVAAVLPHGQVFVYGFEPFVEAAEAAIDAAGGDPTNAKVENFG